LSYFDHTLNTHDLFYILLANYTHNQSYSYDISVALKGLLSADV